MALGLDFLKSMIFEAILSLFYNVLLQCFRLELLIATT